MPELLDPSNLEVLLVASKSEHLLELEDFLVASNLEEPFISSTLAVIVLSALQGPSAFSRPTSVF